MTANVGRPLRRREDFRFLTGRGRYVDDIKLPGTAGQQTNLTEEDIETIVTAVGRNPMSLRLAAEFVREQGIQSLQSIETRSFLFLRLKTEKIQAQLYGRILGHIHDPDVRKLAYPGLIVRRITPEVIREVLAGPCDIALPDQKAADRLFDALAQEIALIQSDGERAVKHRLDIRRVMLGDLLAQVPPETVTAIDRGAVEYYRAQTGARARAEEIYHRLRLGEPPETVGERWIPGVEEHLRNALEELSPSARLWLSRRLGVTPDPALLAQADLETWEDLTLRDAQRFLQSGNPHGALDLVSARKERSPASPLYRVEAETLRLLGRDKEARETARRGIGSAAAAGNSEVALDLQLLLAAIEEGEDRHEAALDLLEHAKRLVDHTTPPLLALRLFAARIRVRRSLGAGFAKERSELMEEACGLLTPVVLRDTRGRPALLRELVAELGGMNLQLLRQGLDVVGLELDDEGQRQLLARALASWDNCLRATETTPDLAARAGITANHDWAKFVETLSATQLTHSVLDWLSSVPPDGETQEQIADVFRSSVAASLRPARSG
jgi:hypothetical protein